MPKNVYAYTAPMSPFLKDSQHNAATNDLAALRGKRIVIASEVRDKAKCDDGRVKSLTGET
jgi:phage/plasmid-associated DNA primase